MEIEALADAWYVWVGVAVVSVAVGAVVLGLPTGPPPDAAAAANAADRVAVSEYGTAVAYDHRAQKARIGTKQIALRNAAGTDHASVAFGALTPVNAADGTLRSALEALLAGEDPAVVAAETGFESERALGDAMTELRHRIDRDGTEWRRLDGPLLVRSVRIGNETAVLVGF